MAKYFKYFPKTIYTLANNATSVDTVTNLITRFNFDSEFVKNSAAFYSYRVKDGETPEIIADKVYGSSEKHWVILNYNNIVHPQFDWVLDSNSFNSYIEKKYKSRANSIISQTGTQWAKQTVHSYYNRTTQTSVKLNKVLSVEEVEIDANTYANTESSTSSTFTLQDGAIIKIDTLKHFKTYLEYEDDLNESKRTIKLMKPEFVSVVEDELKRIVK